jgi:imidazolonepropionase-like amidohydrolase
MHATLRSTARRAALLGAFLVAARSSAVAADAATAEDGFKEFALRAGKVYTVSGGVLLDATILVRGGKIAAVGTGVEVPAGLPIHDLRAHVVLPGLVDAETTLASDVRDTRKSIAPHVRALDGWDFYRELREVLQGGVTTVYLAPGIPAGGSGARLVSGRGAVVKTAGKESDPRARVLREAIGVQVTLGEVSRQQPPVYDPPVAASPDNPFEVLQPPLPQSRAGEFLALRRLLARAEEHRAALDAHFAGLAPPPPFEPEAAAVFPLLAGADHLRVRANKARDLYHMLELARQADVALVIEGGAEAERLVPWLLAFRVPVIVPGAFQAGRLPGGDLASPAIEGRLEEEAILRMQAAGVKVVITSPSDAEVKSLLVQAAAAVRLGMDPADGLRTITLNPAEVLGIADRVGSIEPGKDADLVVLGGDPFGPESRAQAVLLEGEVVYREAPPVESDCVVVRCGRILDGMGREVRAGVVLVRAGKIEYVGPGALLEGIDRAKRVIDASACTVVPGLIDASGTAGLRAETLSPGFGAAAGTAGAAANAALRLAESIDPREPSLRELVRAGITTAVIAPPPAGEVSGQVSVLKLAAVEPARALVKPYAALAFGSASSRVLKAAKAYHDAWAKWEEKRDEAKAKGEELEDEAPRTEDAQEPFRALFKGEVPALIEVRDLAGLEAAVKLLREEHGVRVIASGLASLDLGRDLDQAVEILRRQSEGAVLAPPFVTRSPEDRETIHWPRELAARGVAVSLASRAQTGARLLPLQVAYAVSEGWDARQALRAMTSVPARQFDVEARVGAIEKGRDADLVFLSGEPFALTTRVLGVMVDGRVVHGVEELAKHVED